MIAETQYTDLTGTVAADISDFTTRNNHLSEVANHFNIDQKKFKVVGLDIYGIENFSIGFICVDKIKSTETKEHIVRISIDHDNNEILSLIFKRLHIVLYEKNDDIYREMKIDDEIDLQTN
jgi:hypothetical protein